jgi:hypothetical protein
MHERRAITNALAKRYQSARKKQRSRMLDEFVALTKYRRSYAAHLLANWNRRRVLTVGGVRRIYVFGLKRKSRRPQPPKRPRVYTGSVVQALKQLWALAGGICGKRLAIFIRNTLPRLERFEELILDAESRAKLMTVSPATIDRLLAVERKKYQLKGRATTRPGSLLKHQIPIRTFADWNEKVPGFVEIDLVAHDGGIPGSEVIHSLTVTDVASGWTEVRALKTKARRWVLEALQDITRTFPVALRGIDCDNGGEFINDELTAYCHQCRITFTRSRPYRKNDSCFVEQKNYSIVRRSVGYARFDTTAELTVLSTLYHALGLFTNFFQPVMKLKRKIRVGSRVRRLYDTPRTPVQRILDHPKVDPGTKQQLTRLSDDLNPAQLRRTITNCQQQLESLVQNKMPHRHSKKRIHFTSIS